MKKYVCLLFWVFLAAAGVRAQADANPIPTENEGILRLPSGVSLFVTVPDGAGREVRADDGPAVLPFGQYKVNCWCFQKEDADGTLWKLRGFGGPIQDIEIGPEPVTLEIKPEPIHVSLNVRCRGDYIFTLSLKGPAGEALYLFSNDKRIDPPPVVITNQDKSFSVTLTGKYG